MTQITRDDWLAALAEAERVELPPPDPSLVTIAEFAVLIGKGRTAAEARMNRIMAAGKAEQTTKPVLRRDGRVVQVTAYRLVK